MKDSSPTVKICTKCKEEKPISDFRELRSIKNGKEYLYRKKSCKNCVSDMNKRWAIANPNYKKMSWAKKTEEERRNIYLKQKNNFEKYAAENREKIIEYRKRYHRSNKEAKDKYMARSRKSRELLSDNYIVTQLSQNSNLDRETIRQYPELIETKRLIIQTKRLCKTSSN